MYDSLINLGKELLKYKYNDDGSKNPVGFIRLMQNNRAGLIEFYKGIGKPLKRQNCSSCLSQAYYKIDAEIEQLKLKSKNMATTKKYKFLSHVPNYRSRIDGRVYNPNTLTDEAASAMVENNPRLLGSVFEEIETPVKEEKKEDKPKRKRRTKAEIEADNDKL